MAKSPSLKNIHRLLHDLKNEAPPNRTFLADFNMVLEKIDEEYSREPSKSYKPSSLHCIRNMYFQMIGEPIEKERADACLIGICQSGSARHEHIQSVITRMKDFGIDCEYVDVETYIKEKNLDYLEVISKEGFETKVHHKILNLRFMTDGILRYRNKFYILEIKTEHSRKWQSRFDVAEDHILQGTCYSLSFGIDEVLFVYENRDTTDKKAFILEVTDNMKYDVVSKIEQCDECVKLKVVPPLPRIDEKHCKYCKYRMACTRAGI